jgi:hypothetical protein
VDLVLVSEGSKVSAWRLRGFPRLVTWSDSRRAVPRSRKNDAAVHRESTCMLSVGDRSNPG